LRSVHMCSFIDAHCVLRKWVSGVTSLLVNYNN
jgi:hypothetical protein